MTEEHFGVCRTMSWIAFRREDMLTDNPDELRANMKRHKKRVVVKNPAAEILRAARSGALVVNMRPRLPITAEGTKKMSPIDWMQISEDDIWRKAEFEWQVAQGKIKLEVRSVPRMRMLMCADDGREFENMGQAFAEWMEQGSGLSDDEQIDKVFRTGKLTTDLCLSFWQWLGRTDKAPNEIKLFLNREEFEAFLREEKKRR